MAITPSSLVAPLLLVFSAILTILAPSCTAQAGDVLFSGQYLSSGEYLQNGVYKFTLEADCNVVLYDNGASVWSSKTSGMGVNCQLRLLQNGNLALYDGNNKLVTSTKPAGVEGEYVLVLRFDRNVVIYGGKILDFGTAKNK